VPERVVLYERTVAIRRFKDSDGGDDETHHRGSTLRETRCRPHRKGEDDEGEHVVGRERGHPTLIEDRGGRRTDAYAQQQFFRKFLALGAEGPKRQDRRREELHSHAVAKPP